MIGPLGVLAWLLRPVHSLCSVLLGALGLLLATPLLLVALMRFGKRACRAHRSMLMAAQRV